MKELRLFRWIKYTTERYKFKNNYQQFLNPRYSRISMRAKSISWNYPFTYTDHRLTFLLDLVWFILFCFPDPNQHIIKNRSETSLVECQNGNISWRFSKNKFAGRLSMQMCFYVQLFWQFDKFCPLFVNILRLWNRIWKECVSTGKIFSDPMLKVEHNINLLKDGNFSRKISFLLLRSEKSNLSTVPKYKNLVSPKTNFSYPCIDFAFNFKEQKFYR